MSHAEVARLEAHVLDLLDLGREVRLEDLRRDFPGLEEADIQRVQTSAEIFHAWLEDLGDGADEPRGRPGGRPGRSWLEPGERIGGYVVLRRVQGGGMGQVYHAVQESLYPRRVALKVHRLEAGADHELRRARREAEVASRLVHPHLAAIHDMGLDEERGLVYFSMQLVEGGDLRDVLRDARAGLDRAGVRRVVMRISEVAGALAELHGRGYVHRDVKPENVLLRPNAGRDGRSEGAVLVDFGLVRAERVLRGDGALLAGTPGYAPPEADLSSCVTPAWDVYSLGVVLHEALSGSAPPRDARGRPLRPSPSELASLRRSRVVDADLAAIVARATRSDPEERYPNAGALQSDLERWLAGETVSVRRPPPLERLVRAARRRPRRAAAALCWLALLAGAGFLAGLLAREVGEVRRGLAALERGEPARGYQTLAAASPLLVRWLAGGRPDLQADLRDGTRRSPLAAVALAELERGRGAALELAAAFLERDGFDAGGVPAYPALEAFLLRDLDAGSAATRSQALRVAARLFYERPPAASEPAERLAPFRERLLAVLADPRSARGDVLHAISALGGSGTPAELDAILAHAEAAIAVRDLETVRLACKACDRILLRFAPVAAARGGGAVDWSGLERRLAALWSDARVSVPAERVTGAWALLVRAWGLAQRALGRRPELAAELLDGLGPRYTLARAALQGSADRELRALLLDTAAGRAGGLYPDLHAGVAHRLGQTSAYLDEELRDELEETLRARGADEARLDELRAGWDDGRTEVERGFDPGQAPDDRSRMRHLLQESDAASDLDLPPVPRPADAVARWRFDPPERSGWATGARLGGGAYLFFDEYDPHLRLPRSGSWVEARLRVDEPLLATGWNVVVTHLAAARPYLPFEGEAWIQVELDGVALAERLRVGHVGSHELTLGLEADQLAPGEHVVRVTVVEASTTYWLDEVRVEPR